MKSHWNTTELVRFRVYGEPQPFPKKVMGKIKLPNGMTVPMPVSRDFRERTNPHTGKKEKYDRGHKRKWMEFVREEVARQMFERDLEPFPANHPIAVGLLFFLTRSKSCKLLFPSQAPDGDNMDYAVWNALKTTKTKKRGPGKYPDGVLYYDDCQIVWRLAPSGWLWANKINPPGVLITVQDALVIQDKIMRVAASPEWSQVQP